MGFLSGVKGLVKDVKKVVNAYSSGSYTPVDALKSYGSIVKDTFSDIGNGVKDYVQGVASNPSIHSVTNGLSKNTWLGDSLDKIGSDYSVNQVFGGFKDLLRNVSGQQAEDQYQQSRQDSWNMFNEQMDYAKNQYKYMAEDMARAGLNPLASLGASPASAPSGSPASPTASSSAGGLGAIASFISPILGAVVSRLNNADDNATQTAISGARNTSSEGIATAGNKSREKIAEKNIQSGSEVREAQARNLNATAENQEYETEYNKKRGISSNTSDKVKTAKEIANAVSEVSDGIKQEQNDELIGKNAKELKEEARKMFNEAFPSKKPSSLVFEGWYNTWARDYAKNPISFFDFCQQNKKYGKYFKAWKSSRGQ